MIQRQKEMTLHKKISTTLRMLMVSPSAHNLQNNKQAIFPYALVTSHLKNRIILLEAVLHSRLCLILIDLTTNTQSIRYFGTLPMFPAQH